MNANLKILEKNHTKMKFEISLDVTGCIDLTEPTILTIQLSKLPFLPFLNKNSQNVLIFVRGKENNTKMSILEYNGGAIIAMSGKNCVAIATDTRLGLRQQTVACNFQKVRFVTIKLCAVVKRMSSE